jgi:hypothetical protein
MAHETLSPEWEAIKHQVKQRLQRIVAGGGDSAAVREEGRVILTEKVSQMDQAQFSVFQEVTSQAAREVIASIKEKEVDILHGQLDSVRQAYDYYAAWREVAGHDPNTPEEDQLFTEPVTGIEDRLKDPAGANWSKPERVKEFFQSVYDAQKAGDEVTSYDDLIKFQSLVEIARKREEDAGDTTVTTSKAVLGPLEEKLSKLKVDFRDKFSPAMLKKLPSSTKEGLDTLIGLNSSLLKIRQMDQEKKQRALRTLDSAEKYKEAEDKIIKGLLTVDLGTEEDRINDFAQMVMREYLALIGEGLDLPFSTNTENVVRYWAEITRTDDGIETYQELWTKINALWQTKDNALNDTDGKQLEIWKRRINNSLRDFVVNHQGEQNYQEKYQFIDVMANRVNVLHAKYEKDRKAREEKDGDGKGDGSVPSKGPLTEQQVMQMDPEKEKDPERLYESAKKLWPSLFARLEVSMSVTKSNINKKYESIISALENHGGIWVGRARYLKDRRNLYDATCIGCTSAFTLNYDDFYKGGSGWLGAGVPSEYDTGDIARLLYGNDIDWEKLESSRGDKEEEQRIRHLDTLLAIIWEKYTEFTPGDANANPPRLPSFKRFHATQNFNEALKKDFGEEVKRIWADEELHKSTSELSPEELEVWDLAMTMQALLDLRTLAGFAASLGGWSPKDDINNTIGTTTKRFGNGKGMYVITGKGKQFVNPALAVSHFSKDVEEMIDSVEKTNNYIFSTEYATPIWLGYWAPSIDDEEGISDDEMVAFRRKRGEDAYVPMLSNSFWLPHKRYKDEAKTIRATQEDSIYSPNTRNKLLTSAKSNEIPAIDPATGIAMTKERRDALQAQAAESESKSINLKGLLNGATAAEAYVASCEEGFTPSGDLHKDIDAIKLRVTEIAEKISPTKALPTMNSRILANEMHEFARLSLLAFSKKYKSEKKANYFTSYVGFLQTLRSSIAAAPTASIKIPDPELRDANGKFIVENGRNKRELDGFRKRFGIPLETAKPGEKEKIPITVKDYVLALLPEGKKTVEGGEVFIGDEISVNGQKYRRSFPSKKTKELIMSHVDYHERREKNNAHLLHHMQELPQTFSHELSEGLAFAFRKGGFVEVLHHHPHHGEFPKLVQGGTQDGRSLVDFYQAIKLPDLSAKEKQADDKK